MSMQMTSTDETSAAEPLLAVRGLKKHFDQSGGVLDRLVGETASVRAVDGVDLTVRKGETLAIVGESGCGKSTLGRTILNLHDATDGTVEYRGTDLADLSQQEMRPYRRDLQMIFQDPLASLNPRQTVGEIITTPMEVHGIGDSDEDRLERTKDLLRRVGLKAGHIERYPNQFSGGQQQRVGIARALALEPELIIADEPVSALDVSVQAQILNLLEELQDDLGLSLVFIAHNLSVVRHVADRVAVMYLGRIVETAPVVGTLREPAAPLHEIAAVGGAPHRPGGPRRANHPRRVGSVAAGPAVRLSVPHALSDGDSTRGVVRQRRGVPRGLRVQKPRAVGRTRPRRRTDAPRSGRTRDGRFERGVVSRGATASGRPRSPAVGCGRGRSFGGGRARQRRPRTRERNRRERVSVAVRARNAATDRRG